MSRQGARRGNDARANSRKHIDKFGVMSDIDAIAFPSSFQQDSVDDADRFGAGTVGLPYRRDDGTRNILNLRRCAADNGKAARIVAAQVRWHETVAAFGGVSRHRRAV